MNWQYKIELIPLIRKLDEQHDLTRHEEKCPQECLDALADEISKAVPLRAWPSKIRSCRTIAELNRVLDGVYNAADRSRVWCGI